MAKPPFSKKIDSPEKPLHVFKRRKVDRVHQPEENMAHDESNWLVSYADMMTLLFGFFVLMYTFSRIDEKKFEIVRKDVARYFGGQVKINPTVKKVEEEIKEVISQAGLDKQVQLVTRDSELELRFQGTLHFEPGSAKITDDSSFILSKLIDLIKRTLKADSVSIEGHTHDEYIASSLFPSNWELSSARASAVVREFEKFGFNSSKLTAIGYGSSRPLLPNRSNNGDAIVDNQKINQRVVVLVGFTREIEDAIQAMKTNQFVSADAPELNNNKAKANLIHEGKGELTWHEKVNQDLSSLQEKLKLAEERLKEKEERGRAAKRLAETQNRLNLIEKKIENSDLETQKYFHQVELDSPSPRERVPASNENGSAPKK